MPEIREATIDDSDRINRVSAHLGYASSSSEEARDRLVTIMASAADRVWVYEEDNEIKGWLHLFVSVHLASPRFAEIGGLVVDKTCRRRGIGRKLVERAMQWAKSSNLPLRVRCNASREAANRFYETIGFACIKTQKVHQTGT